MSRRRSGRAPGRVHVIGAGLAGLAAAVELVQRGRTVTVHEATRQAGGRCRSFVDPALDALIDNGNHLLMGANTATFRFLDLVGEPEALAAPAHAAFPFLDLTTGERWTIRPSRGPLPWWVPRAKSRIPGTAPGDYAGVLRMMLAGPKKRVSEITGLHGTMVDRFWEPLTVAVLNTEIEAASARLLGRTLALTFARGEAASRPYMARDGLSPALVDPAVAFLTRLDNHQARFVFNSRLRGLEFGPDGVTALDTTTGLIPLAPEDSVVLAVTAPVAHDLLPDIVPDFAGRPIVNAHFSLPAPAALPEGSPLLGLIGGTGQWLFVRGSIASVTVSAATGLVDEESETIARRIWPEVARALDLGSAPLGAYRIIKEKRATFAQTPANVAARPGPDTPWRNLVLAGDWTDTGLPATIEGAIRSGFTAAGRLG